MVIITFIDSVSQNYLITVFAEKESKPKVVKVSARNVQVDQLFNIETLLRQIETEAN